jgi:hypothetical protein
MPTQEQWEESDHGKEEKRRLMEHFNRMFPPMGVFADPVIEESEDNFHRQVRELERMEREKEE